MGAILKIKFGSKLVSFRTNESAKAWEINKQRGIPFIATRLQSLKYGLSGSNLRGKIISVTPISETKKEIRSTKSVDWMIRNF